MGVQPGSLVDGHAAAASTDTLPAAATIATPTPVTVVAGTPETITGTAADAGGGRVGAVEISTDGGTTWHPAIGRESWSYTWTPAATAHVTPLARAADDSGNLFPPDASSLENGTQTPLGSATAHRRARVKLRPGTVRMSRRGTVRLRVTCVTAPACRVHLRLRLKSRPIASKTATVAGGTSKRVTLRLRRSARKKLVRKRTLRVKAIATVHDRESTSTSVASVRLRAPGRAAGRS
jgi:hypothetical protein